MEPSGCGEMLLPPTTKLGQGYVFTRVCDSVHRGVLSQHAIAGGIPACLAAGLQGGCLLPGGLVETPPGRLLLRAVCILLECILVQNVILKFILRGKLLFALPSDFNLISFSNKKKINIDLCFNSKSLFEQY